MLTQTERDQIQQHAEIGGRILSTANDLVEISEYVLAHHERWDGKGYPKGLKAEEIPLESRIITIADVYDALTSERSYKDPVSKELALEELRKNAGTQLDPELVKLFIEKITGVETD